VVVIGKLMIEKNIFQTFFTKELPGPINEIINRHINNNPDYRYFLFDDNDNKEFIHRFFDKDIIKAYESLQIGAAKADFWRYLVLHKYGGAYLDLDSCFNIPLNQIIREDDKAIITRESHNGIFVQWCLFFAKGHPVLKETIKRVTNNILRCISEKKVIHEQAELYKLTGPPVITQIIEELYSTDKTANSVYESDDTSLATNITVDRDDYVRFVGCDYNGACSFKHEYDQYLSAPYIQKQPWTVELRSVPLVKW